MDGSGAIPNSFPNLSSLVGVAQPGDVIRIQGLTDPSGIPVAYADVVGLPTQTAEVFPIVLPYGVTILANDSTPVYFAACQYVPVSLIRIDGASTNLGLQTAVRRLTLVGGQVGLDLDEASGAGAKQVTLRNLTFCRNTIGLSVIADGSKVLPLVKDCVTTDTAPGLIQSPMLQAHGVGMRFGAKESNPGAPGRVEARLEHYLTSSEFPQSVMAPQTLQATTDLEAITSAVTTLVQVHASGSSDEHDGPIDPVQPIAEVVLDVVGGNWQGKGGPGSGWDLGLWAATESTGFNNADYTCGYRVSLSGTTVNAFNLAGIHGTASATSRGEIHCAGQTVIRNTGTGWPAPPAGGFAHSGILMYTFLGYLGLELDQTLVKENAGNGIWLHSPQSGLLAYPTGIHLRATDCGIHGNGLDGIAMEAGTENLAHPGSRGQAIVGGTWDLYDGWLSLVDQGNVPVSNPYGVGAINRCAISNNARHGIRAKVLGRVEDPGTPDDQASMVACRVVNSILWNNPHGGMRADLEEDSPGHGSPTLLLPLVHSTLIGNGDLSGYNVEVTDTTTSWNARFEYASGPNPPPAIQSEVVATRLFDSIFQRKTATASDFGPQLTMLLIEDMSDPMQVLDSRVGVEGVRFAPAIAGLVLTEYSDIDVLQLMSGGGAPNWISYDPLQFYLSSLGNGELDNCVSWNLAAPDESQLDHGLKVRPSNLLERDFGATQFNP